MSRSRSSSAKHEIDDSSSNTSENESSSAGVMSENDVSYDDHHAVEPTHRVKNDQGQGHYHHHHHHHRQHHHQQSHHHHQHHQDNSGGHCSYFKPKSFMSAHVPQTPSQSGPVSVRYSVQQAGTFDNQPNRSRLPARQQDGFVHPTGNGVAYFPQGREGMMPQGSQQQFMAPQFAYDNFGYKPTNFQYQQPYQFFPHPMMMNQMPQPQQMRSRRSSSENLDSVGMMPSSSGGEYISIKYMAPGRLVKGEAANSFRPGNQQQQTQSFSSPIQMMPNGGMGFVGPQHGSQHALNFNQGFPQNGSYRAYNFDLFQQQAQPSMMVAQVTPPAVMREQPETEDDNVSRKGSKRDKKDKNTINKKSGNKSGEDISEANTAEVVATSTTAVSSVTNKVVNKPAVSSQWIVTGGAPPDQGNSSGSSGQAAVAGAESRNAGVSNYFRSTNGYYDDSINDRAMLGAVDKEDSQFKKYCKICSITAVVSFVIISIVLGALFGFILKNEASTEKPREVARLFPVASNLTEVANLIVKDVMNATNTTLPIPLNSSSTTTTPTIVANTTLIVTEKTPEVLNVTSAQVVSTESITTTIPEVTEASSSPTAPVQDIVTSTEKLNETIDLQDSAAPQNMTGKAKKFFLLNMINQFVKNSSDTIIKPTQEAVNSSISAIESTITSLHSALSNIISNKMDNLVPNMTITGLEKFALNTTSRSLVSEETSTVQPEIITQETSTTTTTTLEITTTQSSSTTESTTTIASTTTTDTSSTTSISEQESSTSTTTSQAETTTESTTQSTTTTPTPTTLSTTQESTEIATTQVFEFDLETPPAEDTTSTSPTSSASTSVVTTVQSSL